MRRPGSAILGSLIVAMLVVACSAPSSCPPGEDCRWLQGSGAIGLWLGADPEPAAVLRVDVPGMRTVSLYAIWERCGAEVCPWTPPAAHGRLERQDNGAWVVALTRSAFSRDPDAEVTLLIGDGSRLWLGLALAAGDQRRAPATDLPACIRDLGATLAAASLAGGPVVFDVEIELVCRIWSHPSQGRSVMHWHPLLHHVARAHACDMAARDYFGHTDPDGVGPNRRAHDAGYALPDWYDREDDGNNIESLALRGPVSTPESTVEQWLASPLHRQHVLGETSFEAGQDDTATGYCRTTRDGVDMHYWAFVSAHGTP
jgi:hypothetical protein